MSRIQPPVSAPPSPLGIQPRRVAGPLGPIAVYEAGDGPPVVLVHAIDAAASSLEMRPLFEGLAARRRVIAFDLPGFGCSARPRARYRPVHMQRAFRDVVAATTPDTPADVIALSLSGQYVALDTRARPERVRRLVLLNPTGVGRFEAHPDGALDRALERWLQLPVIGQAIFGGLATRWSIDWYLDRTVTDPACIPSDVRELTWRLAHEPGARWAPPAFLAGLLDVPGIEDAYRRLTIPTLMLFGERPRFSDPDAMCQAMTAAASVTIDVIPGTRDLPHWERPAQTIERIERFLA